MMVFVLAERISAPDSEHELLNEAFSPRAGCERRGREGKAA